MDKLHKIFFITAVIIILGGFISVNLIDDLDSPNSLDTLFDSGNSITGLAVAEFGSGGEPLSTKSTPTQNCNQYSSEGTCNTNNCFWNQENGHAWCEGQSCFSGDATNSTYCEVTLNSTYGVECGWEIYESGLCDPLGGESFGSKCEDFDNDADACYGTYFCIWDSANSLCEAPAGGFDEKDGSIKNPSCSIVTNAGLCGNITGCSWSGTACSGKENTGIFCSDLNKTVCSDVTFLSSCCSWNGTSCGTSFQQECYNNVPELKSGQGFCEDKNVYKNQTACNELASSPWYMPCIWESQKNECHFNSQAFGEENNNFDEIGSESSCEAQGGNWVSEKYTDPSTGKIKVDTWCEFNFGQNGNCDSSCWACENDADVINAATAQSVCQNSELGYCQFSSDTNANNGYGWCEPKDEFILGGGKSFHDDCSAANFLNNPESKCLESSLSCNWINDSNAENGVGFCVGASEQICENNCFSCYDSTSCASNGNGGDGACSWDSGNNYCKPSGFSGEVCFDGKDNDGNGLIDCSDSGCASDKFCGGEALAASFGNCPSFEDNATCFSNSCVWIVDKYDSQFGDANAGFCDFPGSQCLDQDDSEAACNSESGCGWVTSPTGFCEVNATVEDNCFSQFNQTSCETFDTCGWMGDSETEGFCDNIQFIECFDNQTRQNSQSLCEANVTIATQSTQICGWQNFGSFQACEPICYGLSNSTCESQNGQCELVAGLCEPNSFGGKCFEADGNQTMCNGELNTTCSYFPDSLASNGVAPANVDGWCNPKGDAQFINTMGDSPPIMLGEDGLDVGVNSAWDITGVGLKDTFDTFIFGIGVDDELQNSGICNSKPIKSGGLGSGEQNHTFFWYIDGDGVTNNGCASRDDSANTGYEFSFEYSATYASSLTETKVSYQCVGGKWSATPIPLSSTRNVMCSMIGGAMAGIDKAELSKFISKFDKAENMRMYVTVGNYSLNKSQVVDTAGPYYYSHGSYDFEFEDCSVPGGDADGDGLTSSNDPNCFDYLKFGFVPNEMGFQCSDGKDNDADGLTDCNDPGCTYDQFQCGSSLAYNATDKTAPKVIWLQATTFPDAANIRYDTNEPANGTLKFYATDSSCIAINKTIRDYALIDSFTPDYQMLHQGTIDNSVGFVDALGYELQNGTSYYYKTTVCDISNNCAISACLNFTTKSSIDSCKGCSSTFNMPFTPASGTVASDPLGNLAFVIETSDGNSINLDSNAASGKQLNYTQLKNFNIAMFNPNATDYWSIKFINASVVGKIDTQKLTFSSASKDVYFESNSVGDFVGLGGTKCQELINTFRPKKLQIGMPGNDNELWQCDEDMTDCVRKDIGTNATKLSYNITTDTSIWEVPAEWGC